MNPPAALANLAVAGLRRLDPERAHDLALAGLEAGLGPRSAPEPDDLLRTRIVGLDLPHPIGLAAGFDKDARAPAAMLRAGFAWVECGTVTPVPQAGNPRPRLFRLARDRAVINRLGFNNGGLAPFAERLSRRDRAAGPVGANIGANKDSADRIGDYVTGLHRVWPLADHVTVNISSPNTAGLRALQSAQALDELGGRLAEARAALRGSTAAGGPPLLLKIAPDLDADEI
ncbi:MAG: dihydroorotate dehydrogenase (quinone), partial [Caulobacteraceae bacterium]|nr:dihydroorotate dehydrogenase (quinone) [Caulobacter sp.]